MLINADFDSRAVVLPDQYHWAASPQPGVERVMLDRIGEEKARATSIVRYAAGSRFPRHPHPGGEEILVLAGTFSDEQADYPRGWYLRNPPGSSHQPFSDAGAVILVKLWQMPRSERDSVRIDTREPSCWTNRGDRESCLLFTSQAEQVSIERLPMGSQVFSRRVDGAEMLVLEGSLQEEEQQYTRGSWIRLPPGYYPGFTVGCAGATLYLKTGHLARPPGKTDAAFR